MRSKKQLQDEGRAIAAQLNVKVLYATADSTYFRNQSDANLHGRNSKLQVHVLEYDGAEVKAPSSPVPSPVAVTVTDVVMDELKATLAAVAASKDAAELAAAAPTSDTRPIVLKAIAAKRKELVNAKTADAVSTDVLVVTEPKAEKKKPLASQRPKNRQRSKNRA